MSAAHHIVIQSSLAECSALTLALEGVNWLAKSGMLATSQLPNLTGCSVLFASEASKRQVPVGVICFREEGAGVVVELAYVEPSRRRTGLLRTLIGALKKYAQQRKLSFIEMTVASQNEAALDAIEALDFDAVSHRYRVTVE